MASARQIAANRRNAKKSTGPATREGRARSAKNATRHGLNAELAGDDEAISLCRALLGDAAATGLEPVAPGDRERTALGLARAQARVARAARFQGEVEARIAALVAEGTFAGQSLARAWTELMADAGITRATVIEGRIEAMLFGTPGQLAKSAAKRRQLEALIEELEGVDALEPPSGADLLAEPFLARLSTHRHLHLFDPVREVMKDWALARRYRLEAEAQRRKALRRWLALDDERATEFPETNPIGNSCF